jgi:hypothetical protein
MCKVPIGPGQACGLLEQHSLPCVRSSSSTTGEWGGPAEFLLMFFSLVIKPVPPVRLGRPGR